MSNIKQQIKKAKKHPIMKDAKHVDYDKDGRAQIYVGLREADEFFSPYSYLTYELMNDEVANYIDKCESGIPLNDEIVIEVHTESNTTNEEKQRIRKAVKRHNAEEVVILKNKSINSLSIWTTLKKLLKNFTPKLPISIPIPILNVSFDPSKPV